MKTLFKLILLLIVVAAAYVGYTASRKPDQYVYQRTRVITATPTTLFAQINDLHNFNTWSPWAKLDPNARLTFEGPSTGPGATMYWEGNAKMGKGSMAITAVQPDQSVTYNLVFEKPMTGTATSQITLNAIPDSGTRVTWSMTGPSNFFQKVISVVFNCQRMIEDQYDSGLTNLAAKVEHPTPQGNK